MRFIRESVTIIVILIIIFSIEYITSKKLTENVTWMRDGITSIENKMKENNEEESQKEFADLKEKWEVASKSLALFVEHNELEKVSNDIVIIEANFETDEKDEVMENISELKFMLEHIEEKNQLKLKNFF